MTIVTANAGFGVMIVFVTMSIRIVVGAAHENYLDESLT